MFAVLLGLCATTSASAQLAGAKASPLPRMDMSRYEAYLEGSADYWDDQWDLHGRQYRRARQFGAPRVPLNLAPIPGHRVQRYPRSYRSYTDVQVRENRPYERPKSYYYPSTGAEWR
jgi:hypothetical protein